VLAIKGSDRRAIPRAAVTRLEWSRGRLEATERELREERAAVEALLS